MCAGVTTTPSPHRRHRTRRVHHASPTLAAKKGFAEMLSGISLEKVLAEECYNGRPRIKPGKVAAKQPVHSSILRPPYADSGHLPDMDDREIQVQDADGVMKMRAAGLLAARVLDFAETLIAPGITTDYIDRHVHKMIIDAGAYPSPLNYGGFPKSVCTSLNEGARRHYTPSTSMHVFDVIACPQHLTIASLLFFRQLFVTAYRIRQN